MATQAIARYNTAKGEVALGADHVRSLLCPLATSSEIQTFIRVCMYQRLNPFLGEAYLIKYDAEKPASIVVGKSTFMQRAEAHPQFAGIKAGVVVQRGEETLELVGAMKLPQDVLLGGWATIARRDRSEPFHHTVALAEYTTNQAMWRTKPMTMIRKVAMVQALRDAFPETFTALYDASELGELNTTTAQAFVEAEAVEVLELDAPAELQSGGPGPATNGQEAASAPRTASGQGRVVSTSVRCEISEHRGARLAKHPTLGLVHKLPDGSFCVGAAEQAPPAPEAEAAPADPGSSPGQALPPSQGMELQELVREVLANNFDSFDQFCADKLKMTWGEWLKLGGGVGSARMRLRGQG